MASLKDKIARFEQALGRLRLYLWAIGLLPAAVAYFIDLPVTLVVLILLASLSLAITLGSLFRIRHKWLLVASLSFMATSLFCGAIWYYVTIYQVNELFEEKLPGFSFTAVIRIHDKVPERRQYIFSFVSPGGSQVTFFLSKSERFTFSATDVHGEPYSLEVPLGGRGIPVEQFIYLACEIGVASDRSYIRILMNDKVLQYRILYFPIDLGSRQWTEHIGANIAGTDNGAFDLAEFGTVTSATLSEAEFRLLSRNARFYKLVY